MKYMTKVRVWGREWEGGKKEDYTGFSLSFSVESHQQLTSLNSNLTTFENLASICVSPEPILGTFWLQKKEFFLDPANSPVQTNNSLALLGLILILKTLLTCICDVYNIMVGLMNINLITNGELLVESPYTFPVQTNNSLALLGLDRQIMPILVKLNNLILKS